MLLPIQTDRRLAPGRRVPFEGDLDRTARSWGTHPDNLADFNPEGPVDGEVHLPSADEVLWRWAPDVAAFDEARMGANPKLLQAAWHRARGRVGLGYGVAGDGGWFYTPNPWLAGASRRRRELLDGVAEYKVMWAERFWRCSVFMNDVIWQAGWKPDLSANAHYRLAGQVHVSKAFVEIPAAEALPGALFQKYGGSGSDESHNAVLTTAVEPTQTEAGPEWRFRIVGAEEERARENPRSYLMKPGSNETVDGRVLRFFRPRWSR